MRILALITARGGSKRIPRKNIRCLAGQPLINWTIQAAKEISDICEIFVSTDDDEIAETSRNAGASAPWLRPAELATDMALSIDVCIHALDWYEKEYGNVDGLLLLQPTSPFRRRASIIKGISLFKEHKFKPVIGMSHVRDHPLHCFKIEGNHIRPIVDGNGLNMRSQDLPEAYVVNGAFYLITAAELRNSRTFFTDNVVPLVFENPEEGIDIDTDWDWLIAELIAQNFNKNNH